MSRLTYIIEEFGAGIALNVVGVEVTPAELDVDPIFVAGCTIENILVLQRQCLKYDSANRGETKPTFVTMEGREMFH